jgi:flagellar hook-associated protein 1 FlgK
VPSLFFTLNIARRGLTAQQAAMNTSGHNIANANTEGYSRQRAVMQTTTPWPVPSVNMPVGAGQIGTGVEVALIERIRDTFLDRQIRNELQALGHWEQRSDALQQVEVVFMEPSETGLSTLLSQFWDSWQELSKYPESMPVRTTVIETAQALAEALRHTHQQLTTLRSDLNELIDLKVEEINTLARQIADLNQQIFTITAAGMSPNDLLDRRDLLLDQLGKIVAITVEPVTIDHGGQTVDTGAVRVRLQSGYIDADADSVYDPGEEVTIVDWGAKAFVHELQVGEDGGIEWQKKDVAGNDVGLPQDVAGALGGELEGLLYARDILVQGYLSDLNQFASGLAGVVNTQHRRGLGLDQLGDRDFFVAGTGGSVDASNIEVNPDLAANPAKLAAGLWRAEIDSLAGDAQVGPGVEHSLLYRVEVSGGQLRLQESSDGGTTWQYVGGSTTWEADQQVTVGDQETGETLSFLCGSGAPADGTYAVTFRNEVASGDGTNALAIAQLRREKIAELDGFTFDDYYKNLIARLGVASNEAQRMAENQNVLVEQLNQRKESISGVSLDEEMVNLIQYQYAYQAAARVITVVDEMLDTIINRMAQ